MTATAPQNETDLTSQLLAAARNIETYRADLGMTKADLLRTYPELGSDKTYNKLVAGDASQLAVPDWAEAYLAVWKKLMSGNVFAELPLLQLSGPAHLCANYIRTRNRTDNKRFALLLGENGTGKTSSIQLLRSKSYALNFIEVEAMAIWQNRRTKDGTAVPLLESIGEQLGLSGLPSRRNKLMSVLIQALKKVRSTIVIEESQHLCPQGLDTLKNLINHTPSIILCTAIPQLWEDMCSTKEAYRAVKQLIGNRLAFVTYLTADNSDVQAIMESAGVVFDDQNTKAGVTDADRAVNAIRSRMGRHGNLSFLYHVLCRYLDSTSKGVSASVETWEKTAERVAGDLTPNAKR